MATAQSTNIDKPAGTAANVDSGQSIPENYDKNHQNDWRPGDSSEFSEAPITLDSDDVWRKNEKSEPKMDNGHDYPGPSKPKTVPDSTLNQLSALFEQPLNFGSQWIRRHPTPALSLGMGLGCFLGVVTSRKL